MITESVYFVHISDTHFGPTSDYHRHGHYPLPCAKKLVEIMNQLPVTPDFVIHTGDIVTNPHPKSYQLAAETFACLNIPIYYVCGNHDRAQDVHHYLPMGFKEDLFDDANVLSYRFEVKGYEFLVLDAAGPPEIDPHGFLSEAQLAMVQAIAHPSGPPLTIFIHFPCLPLNSIWMDQQMLIINGEQLHQSLLPARHRLRGVFSGHVHQHMQTVKDDILYVSVASTFSQFTAWPNDVDVGLDSESLPGYGFVHLLPQQTIVHQLTFPRP